MLYSDHPRTKPIPPGWAEPLRRWELHLVALSRAQRTIVTRLTHLYSVSRGLGRATPQEVTHDDLETWFGAHQWENETRHAYYSSVRIFFAWLYRNNPDANPAAWLPSIRRPVPPPRPAPDAAIRKALGIAKPRTRLILCLAAELGLRASEIATLNTGDLEPGTEGWEILTVQGKGGQLRLLPVPPRLAHAIYHQAGRGGWVFPGAIDGHLSPRRVGDLATAVLPDPWTLHTLRHRFATTAYNQGTKDLIAVQRALGHKSITTTQRYTATAMDLKDLIIHTTL